MRCPVCGCANAQVLFQSTSWETFAHDVIYEVRRCTNCQVAFTSPALSSEELTVFYAQGLYGETRNRFYSVIESLQQIFQWFRLRKITRVCPSGKLLAIGCGKGRFLIYAALHDFDVWGVEPSENNRKIACVKLGNRVFISMDELPSGERFDVITLWHVLEHISTPVEMLQQIRPYLKPTGYLCVAVPNFASLQAQLGKSRWGHLDVPRHRLHYTPDTLKNVLELAGYQTLQIDHFSIEFNPIGVLQTALNLLGCEPGFVYKLVKRNISWRTAKNKARFLYSIIIAIVSIPLLILPAFLFSYLESFIGKGGTILVYAAPAKLER